MQSGHQHQLICTPPESRWLETLFPDTPDVNHWGFRTPAVGTALALLERMKKTQRMTRILRAQWTVLKKK